MIRFTNDGKRGRNWAIGQLDHRAFRADEGSGEKPRQLSSEDARAAMVGG
jgi:hypothetical protein